MEFCLNMLFIYWVNKHPGSGVITSGNIADSPVMEEMDDNQGLMIIHDASFEHYLTIYLSLFAKAFNKNIHIIFI